MPQSTTQRMEWILSPGGAAVNSQGRKSLEGDLAMFKEGDLAMFKAPLGAKESSAWRDAHSAAPDGANCFWTCVFQGLAALAIGWRP